MTVPEDVREALYVAAVRELREIGDGDELDPFSAAVAAVDTVLSHLEQVGYIEYTKTLDEPVYRITKP